MATVTREQKAIERLRTFARLRGIGGCRVISIGDACECVLCDLDAVAAALSAPPASDPPGLYRQGQEDMRRRVLDIVRDPSDCRIVKKLPIWGVPGMSEAAAAVAPLVERAQQATGGSDASDFRMRQSDPPGLVAAVKELQDAYRECDYRDRVITQAACARADSAMAFVLAYDLTAPAQMPTKGGE